MGQCLSNKYKEINDNTTNDQTDWDILNDQVNGDIIDLFGLAPDNDQRYLNRAINRFISNVQIEPDNISDIKFAVDHTIYCKNNDKNYFVSIKDLNKLQPIQYFQNNNIEIKKISTNITSNKTFFIGLYMIFYGFVSGSEFIINPIYVIKNVID
eukprot:287985_1